MGKNDVIYKQYFIDEVWDCNLPQSSLKAVELGYTITKKETAHDPDIGWTYAERYGYDFEVTCVNGENKICFWENDIKTIIWSFESQDYELEFLNYKFIGNNIEQIKNPISLSMLLLAINHLVFCKSRLLFSIS